MLNTWSTILGSAGYMGIGVIVQYDGNLREHAGTHILEGNTQHTFSHEFRLVHSIQQQGGELLVWSCLDGFCT
jgi:hypothetical protein